MRTIGSADHHIEGRAVASISGWHTPALGARNRGVVWTATKTVSKFTTFGTWILEGYGSNTDEARQASEQREGHGSQAAALSDRTGVALLGT